MSETIYNKLVRDKIPEIIKADECEPITRVLNDEEYRQELLQKVSEEAQELLEASSTESLNELADLLELIYSILEVDNITKEELEKARIQKLSERGGFADKIFLEKVIKK